LEVCQQILAALLEVAQIASAALDAERLLALV
jgi:hypothetical protein